MFNAVNPNKMALKFDIIHELAETMIFVALNIANWK